MKKFIWLFGENLGNTYNNNSYYFWDEVCNVKDEINKYFILSRNKQNLDFYKTLPQDKQDKIVWKNSLKHMELFKKADMYFVTLSYRDILPEEILGKPIKLIIKKPLIYLQHGTLGIKKIGYKGNSYYNNMFRFLYYNPDIKEIFKMENDFNDYQLYYGEFHPRYKKTVEYYMEKKKQKLKRKKILFFITWREYFGDNFETKKFLNKLNRVFKDARFLKYIKDNEVDIKLCMHQFYDDKKVCAIKESIKGTDNIELVKPNEMNLMKELATCDLLITDYSSVGFDCTLLNIPVILFQPDAEEYFKYRDTYYPLEEIEKYSIRYVDELIETIISEKYNINLFFRDKLPKHIDYDYILKGEHIKKMYQYFRKLQLNKITILGYNFTGKGGTVSATKALAEAMLEEGYLVELLSLKMTESNYLLPYGLTINAFYNKKQNKWLNRVKRHLYRNKKDYYYFNYDINKENLIPYIGKKLKEYLESTNSKTIISTRESIHLFVKKFANKEVINKLYFFHTDAKVINTYYPGLMEQIKKEKLENCIFVTKASRESYKNIFNYDNYEKSEIIGNALESRAMISKKEIQTEFDGRIKVVSLVRLSKDREEDIKNIIDFGKYLKDKKIKNLILNIYGQGDYADSFVNEILKNDLDDIISYNGVTNAPNKVIKESTCVVDFCNNQSFGMTYIESILNGRPVFAKENVGSLEVLKEIPEAYYHSNEELLNKILGVKDLNIETYRQNYDIITLKYAREIIARKIINLLK